VANALSASPSTFLIFAGAFLTSAASGFHRPALDASIQKLVERDELPALSALQSLRWSIGSIVGPALGGLSVAYLGYALTYLFDTLSFGAALFAIWSVKKIPQPETRGSIGFSSINTGIQYALGRPELVGTYVVDIIAMLFAMPIALFPAIAEQHGMAASAGLLYSAFAMGSIFITLFSGWVKSVKRQGAAVVIGASLWGVGIIGFGLAPSFATAFLFLLLAGAADTVSAIFRGAIWNQTIPSEFRGRLAGIEMLSYLSGPHLGNARAGLMASMLGVRFSAVSGGALCIVGCLLYISRYPALWRYSPQTVSDSEPA
jgi:MFS family permease